MDGEGSPLNERAGRDREAEGSLAWLSEVKCRVSLQKSCCTYIPKGIHLNLDGDE